VTKTTISPEREREEIPERARRRVTTTAMMTMVRASEA
jgi:hypothetical protein